MARPDERKLRGREDPAAAFAGRVVESPIGKFGKKAAAATETAGKAGLNWVMTGNTEGVRRKAPSATTPRKKQSSKSTSTRVVYVAANPPKPKRRKPQKKNYWDNPPF